MNKIVNWLIEKNKFVLLFFTIASVLCGVMYLGVDVNYNITDYLPQKILEEISMEIIRVLNNN